MKKGFLRKKWLIAIVVACLCMPMAAMFDLAGSPLKVVDDQGRYFVQDFETNVPLKDDLTADTEYKVVVDGQEWIYMNSYVSTNSSYVVSGVQNLRLPKNGSYVVTPVLDKGVKSITLNVTRSGKYVEVFTSTDGGKTWKSVQQISSASNPTITIEDMDVNRVKIGNSQGKDADIDDLIVTAQAFGTEAQVATGEATNITKNSADLSGSLIDGGDQPIKEIGIVFGETETPTVGDNKLVTETPTETSFTLAATGLKASRTYYYRAFAVSNAGTVYGESKSFNTVEASLPVVTTNDVTKSIKKYVSGGMIIDDGGADITEVGVVYSETAGVTMENGTAVAAKAVKTSFVVELPFEEGMTYYVRAYAKSSMGVALGDEKSVTIDENIQPTPDTMSKLWVATDGDDAIADGSEEKPFASLEKAIEIVEPGQRICIKAGTYVFDHRINIDNKNGSEDEMIELYAVGGRAVLDFSAQPAHGHSSNPYQGMRLTSSYWHFYGLDFCNASDNGLLIERNKPSGGKYAECAALTEQAHHNIIENCRFYRNGDTGLQIKNLGAYNRIINCDSYFNCDESEGDADGFAPKISVGDGNYFYGCRAWDNSDDGWDVFPKTDDGFPGGQTFIIENCIAYHNGYLESGSLGSGNLNGFKLGSKETSSNVVLNRCVAAYNGAKGFDQNHNNGGYIILNNCTGITSKEQGAKSYSYRFYKDDEGTPKELIIRNSVAINDNATTDKIDKNTGLPKYGEDGKNGQYGRFEIDSLNMTATLTNCDFRYAAPARFQEVGAQASYGQVMTADRDEYGNMPEFLFAHFSEEGEAAYKDKGVLVPADSRFGAELTIPEIRFVDSAPDMGAFEVGMEYATENPAPVKPTSIDRISSANNNGKKVSFAKTESGLVIVQVEGANAVDRYQVLAYDMSGRLIGQHLFNAASAITLPNAKGMIILKVVGNGVNESHKVIMK